MTILRSAGPVISTRRSCRSAGTDATRQSPSRIERVDSRKSGSAPRDPLLALRARQQELLSPTGEFALQCDDEVERLRIEDARLVGCVDDGARDGAQPTRPPRIETLRSRRECRAVHGVFGMLKKGRL